MSVLEFWEKEDGLRSTLMDLSDNAAKYGASHMTRDHIRALLDNITVSFIRLREARDLGKELDEYEYRLMRLYRDAIDIIQKLRLLPGPV